ncbi:MAG: phosphoribosylformylglycinamidine synthase, purS protein [Candidatus Marinimicrobia bacterium]|nr:phosphoribosylformylglycinamidine synthase, purS protein [Candidatus Neomarinimicrobiota bacterium]MAV92856.1 phosphoribosylformylglycinamidine synthase, purS protein [Candidatus Neomarinimicrobiota bacterium]|tara:strand:- start:2837 stop:3082 length:246 start_codon:yes stop_codon:yes gene_type:complete
MKAKIFIKYKDGILDPQGKVTGKALNSIGINGINSLTIGKYIEMEFGDVSKDEANQIANESCKKLLVNPNTQTYSFEIINE